MVGHPSKAIGKSPWWTSEYALFSYNSAIARKRGGTDMSYLLAGQRSEIERLRVQSRVWEPAGERLLASLGLGSGQRVLEVGCGVMGWLGCLSRWVGEHGVVIGTDIANNLLDAARLFCAETRLANVTLVHDDFF